MPTFETPKPITATLSTAGARVRIAAGERADTVVLVEPVNAGSKTDVKVAEKTAVDFSDGQLSVKTIKAGDRNGSVAITVELPVGSRLVLHTAWSDVQADGVFGDCELEVASGQIQLDHVAALHGTLAAGSVSIGHVAGTVEIDGVSAGLRISEVEGLVRYHGTSGRVWIGHAVSDVDLRAASGGSFDIDVAEGSVTAEAATCPIRIGRMTRGHAELRNAAGGIQVGISEGTAAVVDANSTKGTVRNSLPSRDNADNTVKVHARTRLDDVVIHPAA
ncbi:DUF4097 family beta strand repeat-containing protein [Kutzneria sp. CA-103260]|uniref:DUF4097 family beta strand repeat-containing protein n=1 Tax=Kutzneria sp. CA-103260 TaxID=2802641 RepID=UPI001BA7DBFB|nr:DUF4097 family beta strand repeat-containing protein [Kutzneria sp. CA-103260]QUQ64383.1 hypothetical protein JJ691_21030 [Kutzneria sp. CA-103260]